MQERKGNSRNQNVTVTTCVVDFPHKNKVLDDQRDAGDKVGSEVGQHSRILKSHDVQRATQCKKSVVLQMDQMSEQS